MPTAEEYYNIGIKEQTKRNYQLSIKAFQNARRLDSSHIHATLHLACVYLKVQQFADAIRLWEDLTLPSRPEMPEDFATIVFTEVIKHAPDSFFQDFPSKAVNPLFLNHLNMQLLKKSLLEKITSIRDPVSRLQAQLIALLPQSWAGAILYHARHKRQPSIVRGSLLQLMEGIDTTLKTSISYLNLSHTLQEAFHAQPDAWKNELEKNRPVLHYLLLIQNAKAQSQVAPPPYNPLRKSQSVQYNFFSQAKNACENASSSAPCITECNAPAHTFTGIEELLSQLEAYRLTIEDIRPKYLCPISKKLMHDPVIAADGETYDRLSITRHINAGHFASPMNYRENLEHLYLSPNKDYRREIIAYLQEKLDSFQEQPGAMQLGKNI